LWPRKAEAKNDRVEELELNREEWGPSYPAH